MNKPEKSYASLVMRYVGVGLISGSIVHAGTLGGSSIQYLILVLAGIALFVSGTFLEENNKISKDVATFILVSVLVSIGIGMVSGGTQHYLDNPFFASYIIPFGLFLGYFSFLYRDYKESITTKKILSFLILCIIILILLYVVASIIPALPDSHHH